MWLPMQYTFSRNSSIAALRAGKYSNIRMTQARTIDSTTPLYLVNSTAWGNDRQPSGAPSFLWATAHTLATTNFSTKHNGCCGYDWAYRFDAIDPKRCNINASEAGQIWNWDATNYFMGPIHPRAKIWVGKRLAAAIYNLVYGGTGPIVGPVISSCKMSVDGKAVTVQFNSSLLLGDTVSLGLYNETAIASAMEVQIAKGPNANDGTVPNLIGSSSLSPPPPPMDGTWIPAQIRAAGAPNAITIDVSALKDNGTTPLGIRYAWSDTPCCDGYYGFGAGDAPCPMASCPIKGSNSQLPAMPFIASLVEGTCVCTPPQVC